MSRIISALLGAILAVNGIAMLFAGPWWYQVVPGVTATGPYNPHFVRDIGAAYLVVAGGLGWFAARPRAGWPALAGAAAFLTLHGAIHVFDAVSGMHPMSAFVRDLAGISLPAAVTLALALRRPAP